MDPEQIKALIEAIKNQDGAAALSIAEAMLVAAASGNAAGETAESEPAADPLAASAEPAPPTPEEKAREAALTLLTGATGPAEQTVFLTGLIAESAKRAEQIAALDMSSRRELVGELVKLSVEVPATAWVGDPKDRVVAPRLLAEPLPELRARVAVLKQAKVAPYTPPTRSTEIVTLSAVDAANAKKAGMTAEQFTAAKQAAVKRA